MAVPLGDQQVQVADGLARFLVSGSNPDNEQIQSMSKTDAKGNLYFPSKKVYGLPSLQRMKN